ncbi:MAG: 50S ribosomal protein L23 [Candidatus Berkelbacteria bacterium Gr01-1014_85]|uniref:Large ribosomal subunit protein uL23 n=1 Tax=Candidatus Berkelbacteria bacterium Gr01-1014_85 TaxID=2017150 RepID=A0A554JD96_9BACT|nr:MAG: 50S ribosomal protein L23 [Candidatus Berkelbacteria bacterium Gr01-1014_85]
MIVLVAPVITEKSLALAEQSKYTFVVNPLANKAEIAQAIVAHYQVEVRDVALIHHKSITVRKRHGYGQTASYTKAIVSLKNGQKIKDYQLAEENAVAKTDKSESMIAAKGTKTNKTESTLKKAAGAQNKSKPAIQPKVGS